jgi:hypothetical protein
VALEPAQHGVRVAMGRAQPDPDQVQVRGRDRAHGGAIVGVVAVSAYWLKPVWRT